MPETPVTSLTDKEKLIGLLDEFGVGYKLTADKVTCEEGYSKVEGYSCFMTIFKFDGEGKFEAMGAWE